MEKVKIAENKYYTLYVSPGKNRVYLKILGFWKNKEVVPAYIDDWKKTLAKVDKGFTLLTDASEMKTHPMEVRKLHEEAQALIMAMNVKKVAEIIKDDITEMQLDAVAKTTQFPKRNFKAVETAETWLDED